MIDRKAENTGGQGSTPAAGTDSQAHADYEQGKTFLANGDHAMAAPAFYNALRGFEEENDEKGVARAADQLGDICVLRQDHATALQHFQKACAICEKLGDALSLPVIYRKMARSSRDMKEYRPAIGYYLKLVDIYRDFNNPAGVVEVLQELAEVFEASGERDRAADAYRTAAAIHANFKHKRQADELEAKARASEKQQE